MFLKIQSFYKTQWGWNSMLTICFILSYSLLYAQVIVEADGPGNTYELINSYLGGNAIENPECVHPEFGRHITEAWDSVLNKNVFIFHSHVTPDNDRCVNFDRQRIEIKTYGPSPENVKGSKGEVHTYRWKFKLDIGFQPSSSFTHIHQIKAGDGSDDGSPLITITPRAGNPEKLQIIFTPSSGGTGGGTVISANLSAFKGVWVEVYERVFYEENGTYEINISRVSDGVSLLSYSNNSIDMWRGDATFNRPKWGIYRSLNNAASLRDEQVRFADFCIAEGDAICSATSPSQETETVGTNNLNAYPNPFSTSFTVELNLEEAGETNLGLYNKFGIPVALLANKYLPAGKHQFILESTSLITDVYVLRCNHNGKFKTRLLLKK